MAWLYDLIFGSGVAHTLVILAITIAFGILLGRVKIGGISLGITWILFVGIILSHFGMRIDSGTLKLVKELGLILFVYSVGMQVGPGFFSAFKQGGLKLNMLAASVVFFGVLITVIIHLVTDLPITTMVGILSGAVTNTPGLGAAQQAFEDMSGHSDPTIAQGYAVAYPLAVVGIILSIISFKRIFKVDPQKELEAIAKELSSDKAKVTHISLKVTNPALFGKTVAQVAHLIDTRFVISRVQNTDGTIVLGEAATVLQEGENLFVIASINDLDVIATFIGERVEMHRADWGKLNEHMVSRRVMVSHSSINGKTLKELNFRENFHLNITRVNRAGVDLVARPNLQLFVGDRVTIVGNEMEVNGAEKILGNSLKRLNEPNLVAIFLGIFLGIVLGSLPIMIPGIPQPVKLGLAGGPLIVSILISRFGYKYKLITWTTQSANLMIREIGISLFLAAVGIGAGNGFVETIVDKGGYAWIAYGFIITVVPLLLTGIIGRFIFKVNYFTLIGLIAGSTTDPPALAYSTGIAGNDLPSVGYATVYPLTMFLRVLTAQLLILFLA